MSRLQKTALICAIACLTMGALFAIAVVLFGKFSDFEIRVLLTSLTVGVAAICVLASAAYRHPVMGPRIGYVAMGMQLLAATIMVVCIWAENWLDAVHWQVSFILMTCSVAMAHILALLSARLRPQWKWVQYIAGVIIFLLAAIISSLIADLWGNWLDEDIVFKILAVLTILAALATLVIPILHVISKSERRGGGALVLIPVGPGRFRDRSGREYLVEEVRPPV